MKKLPFFLLTLATIFSCKKDPNLKMNTSNFNYPETKKTDTIDTYFGETIKDPYRWLEDDRSEETGEWVKAQNKVTFDYLNKIPFRKQIQERMEKLWNYEKISAPFKEGKHTYYYKNNGLQNQSVLYRKNSESKEEIFLDPNTFSNDGTTSLGGISFTKDGSLAAYTISEGGSDWRKVIIIETESKKIVGDTIVDVKFSGISWFKNEGFFYSSYEKPEGSELSAKTDQHKLFYHKLGTSQKEDLIVFGDQEKRRYVGGYVTEDEKYLIITAANATNGNEIYIKPLNGKEKIFTIVDNFDTNNDIIDNIGDTFFVSTDYNAPNKKMCSFSLSNPDQKNWKNFINETDNVLNITTGGGYFFANYKKDAVSIIKQYDYNGTLIRDIDLPGIGNVEGFGGKKEEKTLYFSFTNYITPVSIYSYEPSNGKSIIYQKPDVDFNTENYESKQIFYNSKDGTKIPMIITYKKGISLNGKNPTLLYGYGGFNISLSPNFSIANAVWLENGGIYAVANLRGGGEYGKKWHDAGTQLQKQNVFDDFIAAAEYLIKEKYTSSNYLAIYGRSNGGLLIGASMTQRPDLFKVAIPAVGVLDMLRYHTFTAGAGWAYDYGTSQQSKEMFQYLKGYSPVHNVKKETSYPATLVLTGDHDDRVVPAHSFKFAAELQDKQSGTAPVFIRIDVNAGHGAGRSVKAVIQENVDMQSFALYNMGIKELK